MRVLTELEDRKRIATTAAMARRDQAHSDAYEDFDDDVRVAERKLNIQLEESDKVFDDEMSEIKKMSSTSLDSQESNVVRR